MYNLMSIFLQLLFPKLQILQMMNLVDMNLQHIYCFLLVQNAT